jgi:hypothetical protein
VDEGTIVAVAEQAGDVEAVGGTSEGDDDEVTITKEATGAAAGKAGAEEVILSTGPQPEDRRFALGQTGSPLSATCSRRLP